MDYQLTNDFLTVTIASKGAELRSVVEKASGKEYMWGGDPAYWGRVSPVLFPLVGNYFEHESIYKDTTYQVGQHGFARDAEFRIVTEEEHTLEFELTDSPETHQLYPFAFSLVIGYTLNGRNLTVSWTVKNKDTGRIYFSIGAHPAFVCDLNHSSLLFDTDEPLTVKYLNTDTGCLGERVEKMELMDRTLPLSDALFQDDALILEDRQSEQLILFDGTLSPLVKVCFSSPLLGIWSPAGKKAPFVCIEPWYGRSDRDGFNKKLEEREWNNTLETGETFDASYDIYFYESEQA